MFSPFPPPSSSSFSRPLTRFDCSDAKNMARDVHKALVDIISGEANLSAQDAENKLKTMAQQRRFQQDVWS